MCICSLSYRASNAHAPYCRLWSAPIYNILPHDLIKGMIFEKKKWAQNVFWFYLQLLSEKFLILRINERDTIKNVYWSLYKETCQILMTLEFSLQIFEKSSNIKFRKNPSSGSRLVPCGRTERHDEAIGRFSQFWDTGVKSVLYTVPRQLIL